MADQFVQKFPRMQRILLYAFMVLFRIGFAGFNAAGDNPNVPELRVKNKETPVPLSSIKQIGGFVGRRIRANTEGYIKPFANTGAW